MIKKRVFQLSLIIVLFVYQFSFGQTKQTNAAEKGLQKFLQKIPNESKTIYGFDLNDSLELACLGKPFNLYKISPSGITQFEPGNSVNSIISKTNLWYFPVILNNEIKSLLVVDTLNGKWTAVSLGYKKLAGELSKIRKQWPESKGFTPKIIIVFQANKYLFTIPEIDKYNLTLIDFYYEKKQKETSNKNNEINDSKYSTLDNISNVMKLLKPQVEKNMR
jgi:hypothetical protein